MKGERQRKMHIQARPWELRVWEPWPACRWFEDRATAMRFLQHFRQLGIRCDLQFVVDR